MNRIFRCKLQHDSGAVVDYIGPFWAWTPDFHLVVRMVIWNQRRLRNVHR